METELLLQQNLMIMMWSPVKSKSTGIAHSRTNEILQSFISWKDENYFHSGGEVSLNYDIDSIFCI